VPVGTTITWSNSGRAPHTSTSKDGLWDSGLLRAGESFSLRFEKPGLYQYLCQFHPEMMGSVTVQAGGVPNALSLAASGGDGAETGQQPGEIGVQVAGEQAGSSQTSLSGPQGSSPQGGDKPSAPIVNVFVPGRSLSDILTLVAVLVAVGLSLINLFLLLTRARR